MRRTLRALNTKTQLLWRRLRSGYSRKMWVRFGGGMKSLSGYKCWICSTDTNYWLGPTTTSKTDSNMWGYRTACLTWWFLAQELHMGLPLFHLFLSSTPYNSEICHSICGLPVPLWGVRISLGSVTWYLMFRLGRLLPDTTISPPRVYQKTRWSELLRAQSLPLCYMQSHCSV